MKNAKLKMGMIGGGPGSFIGAIHRIAANIDGAIELVCGAFSSDPEKSKQAGQALHLQPQRIYTSYADMIRQEARLPREERMDFVSIVTPNHVHFEPAKMALEAGFHVVLDKPMTLSLSEAHELKKIIDRSGLHFCLTHTYTGYPMVKQARQMVHSGMFGAIRKVWVEYPQGWLSTPLETEDNKQASWRTDPAKSGKGGAMGDIGTHAFNLAEYVSGLQLSQLCADLNQVVAGRQLDDDGAMLLRFSNGASGVLMATQVAAGEENNVKVRVYGEKGGLEWKQEDANSLLVKWLDKPTELYRAGTGYLGSHASHNSRTPAGHPEGYLEAFANHYRNFALCVQARKAGQEPQAEWLDFPGADDGLRGMAFIETAVKSSQSPEKWTPFLL
ncbi:Gfo/Idh/MocA family protein [Cesiribacter andamanensis]|uniref:Putative oxidoreductase ydgJ n=1 Tax=Cesiribacter andamanensis AMV16 TaxID=1279009 RepID=M7N578_9BACT|nr:Gfo/Idh/MocA family oxidoreductase [Cesiribacter andamanensis]EMR02376.1 putative oxidoreductase ydgJ [Cesiribacter andamanensis AMV16]